MSSNSGAPSSTPLETGPSQAPDDLDTDRLRVWLDRCVAGLSGPLDVRRFAGGQSNPTYQIVTPTRTLVLRRKPNGTLLGSAHAVDREFRVMRALHAAGFPVPEPYALCGDDAVIGSMFYVMEMVEGRVLWDARMPGLEPADRRAIYDEQIQVLARLHSLHPAGLGLENFGPEGNYFARQIGRWTKQYRASETHRIPEMERLIDWLPTSLPPTSPSRIVHGDFRLDNMVLAPTRPQVLALLDWELSTLGDPMADLTYFLTPWVTPAGERNSFHGLDTSALGMPTVDEALDRYCALGGARPAVPLAWYFAYNLFRTAAIVQGVAARHLAGNASSPQAATAAGRVVPLATTAWEQAIVAGASG